MTLYFRLILLQVGESIPEVGPNEIIDFWPVITRLLWFLGGFVTIVLLGWYVVGPALSRIVRRRNANNPTIQEAISRYIRLFFIIIAFFVGAGFAGYSKFLTNSTLVVAALTITLGVAGQTVIGSLVSGLVLVFDPEFNVGNYIEWSDGEGEIKSITLRVTRIHTPDGELITIPNTVLTSDAITRPYGRGKYRIIESISISYEDDIDEAISDLEETAIDLDSILDSPKPNAYVDNFGSDAVIINIHYWIENPRKRDIFRIRSEYAKRVKTRLKDSNITITPSSKRDLEGRIEIEKI